MKLKIKIVFLILVLIISAFVAYKSTTKLTYLEYMTINDVQDGYISINESGNTIVQEFNSPYDILRGISLYISTFSKDNNSIWNISIKNQESGKVIISKDYNASLIEDNSFHYFDFNENIRVDPSNTYELCIKAVDVNDSSKLAFYRLDDYDSDNLSMIVNDEKCNGMLCFSVYGGNTDYWWTGFTCLIAALVVLTILLFPTNIKQLKDNRLIISVLTMWLVFLLLCTFSVQFGFTDENDNLIGGMIIAKGGVLYRDYIVQHPPVAYYLCAFFAWLGAGSVVQFRLSYYLLEGILWGLLYYRHAAYFGRRKMLILPVIESIFISVIILPMGVTIISDGIQGICMVVLLLEFLRYYADKELSWNRCIVISLGFWGCFGAAFISVYALIWIFFAFIIVEILNIRKERSKKKRLASSYLYRYFKLLFSILVPFVGGVIYFKLNNCLEAAIEQIYTFNRVVYPEYTNGLGLNPFQPFVNAIKYSFEIVARTFLSIIKLETTNNIILQFVIIVLALLNILILAVKKRYIESALSLFVICFSATRGYGFHGLAAWYLAVMVIVIFAENYNFSLSHKISLPMFVLISIVLLNSYIDAVSNNLEYKQRSIGKIENTVISLTNEGDGIFYDAYCYETLYFAYKDRYPVNRSVYMLPWYMDWYEQDNLNDLITCKPKVAIMDESINTWGYTGYMPEIFNNLHENYDRMSDNPEDWQWFVWTIKQGDD
jgi:hypothetical protein